MTYLIDICLLFDFIEVNSIRPAVDHLIIEEKSERQMIFRDRQRERVVHRQSDVEKVCVCVCMCGCETEREREGVREKGEKGESKRERKGKRERERERGSERKKER